MSIQKGVGFYEPMENEIGIVPGNLVVYRLYRNGVLVNSVKAVATVTSVARVNSGHETKVNEPLGPIDDYRLWMSEDERTVLIDARAWGAVVAADQVKHTYTYELEII